MPLAVASYPDKKSEIYNKLVNDVDRTDLIEADIVKEDLIVKPADPYLDIFYPHDKYP